MAAVEVIIPLGEYENKDAVEKVIAYICRLERLDLVSGAMVYPITVQDITEQFITVKRFYRRESGKQVFHIIFTFDEYLFTENECMKLGHKIAKFWSDERQVVFAVHNDTKNLHIHMVINTVAYTNGNYKSYLQIDEIKSYVNNIVKEALDEKYFEKSTNS